MARLLPSVTRWSDGIFLWGVYVYICILTAAFLLSWVGKRNERWWWVFYKTWVSQVWKEELLKARYRLRAFLLRFVLSCNIIAFVDWVSCTGAVVGMQLKLAKAFTQDIVIIPTNQQKAKPNNTDCANRYSLGVSLSGCGQCFKRKDNSVGRVVDWRSAGHRFDPCSFHQIQELWELDAESQFKIMVTSEKVRSLQI